MAEKKKVLIIDDEIDVVEMCKDALTDNNYEVIYALNGREGVKLAMESSPDLILLDIMLPGMDGWEVIEMLRLNAQTQDIPVVMFTAKKDFKDKILGIQQGAIDYITKPFLPEDLISRIRRIIG